MGETKKVRVAVQFDDDGGTHSERTEEAARFAFKEHPDALYASDPSYLTRIENRDGEPVRVNVVQLNVTVPLSGDKRER